MSEGASRTLVLPLIPGDPEKLVEYARQLHFALAMAFDNQVRWINELPVMVPLAFFQDDAAASQAAVALSDGRTTRGYCAPEDGSIVAIAVRSNDARTAGTLTVEATINGVATGLQAVLNATDTVFAQIRQDQGLDVFDRGDAIGAIVTSDGDWAPVTADLIVTVGVVFSRGLR